MKALGNTLFGILYAAIIYVVVAVTIGRFRHPWMTETQIMINLPDLMMLRDIPQE